MIHHARLFLERVLPTDMVTATGPYINIHWSGPGTDGKKYWDGRACTTVAEACKTVEWANGLGEKDIYVCMSLQSKLEAKVSKKGNPYNKALRLADDAAFLRSLYIDIDVKEGAYETPNDALGALRAFLGEANMPIPSAVVASGSGGFHAHWAFDRALTRVEWQPLADALAHAAAQHGLICDSGCTIDAARILRIPGTFNRKQDAPRPVKLLSLGPEIPAATIEAALAPYIGKVTSRVKPAERIEANGDLGANLVTQRAPIRIEDVARSCGFVARSLGTGGLDNSQPLWFLTAALSAFVEDGREALHTMSDKHPGYSRTETDALYDRAEATQQNRDIGWPRCQKISSYGARECQSCPLLQHDKSPLNYAAGMASVVNDHTLPDRFVRNQDGMIHYRHIDEDGTVLMIPVFNYPIYNAWLSNDPWTFHFVTRLETGRRATVEIPTETIFGKDGFQKAMGGRGFFCTDKEYKLLKEFLVAWLQKLQQAKDRVISAVPFGWSVVDGKIEGFTYAGKVWMRDGDRPAANPNAVLSYQYTPKGELEPWRDLAHIIYEQKRPALDAILAVAFAAPLVRFTGFPGLLLNAYSAESGIGKTTAMKASQAVWGHPVLGMQGLNDTTNSVLGKMGQIRSLPMYWDELKSDQQTKRFVSIVFDLTGGREKSRMNADATLKMSGTWQTMMVSASNDSIIDAMGREVGSTSAGLHRLFEYVVPKPTAVTRDVGAVQRLTGKMEDNYGNAGLIYARFLGTHWRRIEQEVASCQDEICRVMEITQEEGNWAATIAVLLRGAGYANELGLTNIDIPGLTKFLYDVMERMRGEVQLSPSDLTNNLNISTVLAEFLNSMRARNTLVTNRIWTSRGKPPAGTVQIHGDINRLGEIMVQIGQDDKIIRISSVSFSRWMAERGYSRHTLVKRMTEEFGLVKLNAKLGGGTDLTCAVEHILELDANDVRLAAFLDI